MKGLNFSLLFLVLIVFNTETNAQNHELRDYSEKIAGSDLEIEMVAIPGGQFKMGSNPVEYGRKEDEGPERTVKIAPFWMAKFEITWDLYYLFLNREIDKVENGNKGTEIDADIDAVSGATIPYVDMSLGMGTHGFPIVNITHLAASKFCEWLSAKTGLFYRLPTEAEWEYACRAGTGTPYSFGEDDSLLGEYAWYYENSDGSYHKGGLKKPNPWGLYDMYGNVAEWTLDQYLPEAYKKNENKAVENPFEVPNKQYPHVVRGGSWDDDSDMLRSASRQASSEDWKRRDPQLPKSLWWHTDAPFVGFRIVRTKELPKKNDLEKYWGPQVPKKN